MFAHHCQDLPVPLSEDGIIQPSNVSGAKLSDTGSKPAAESVTFAQSGSPTESDSSIEAATVDTIPTTTLNYMASEQIEEQFNHLSVQENAAALLKITLEQRNDHKIVLTT